MISLPDCNGFRLLCAIGPLKVLLVNIASAS
jgi:hypothetical protein